MDSTGGLTDITGLITTVATLAHKISDIQKRYHYAALNVTFVASTLSTIRPALEAIDERWTTAGKTSSSSQQLDHDLSVLVEACALSAVVINRQLGESNLAAPTVFDKLRYVSLDEQFNELTSSLDSQVRALQLLVTVYQWQVSQYSFSFGHSCADSLLVDLSPSKTSDFKGGKRDSSFNGSRRVQHLYRSLIEIGRMPRLYSFMVYLWS